MIKWNQSALPVYHTGMHCVYWWRGRWWVRGACAIKAMGGRWRERFWYWMDHPTESSLWIIFPKSEIWQNLCWRKSARRLNLPNPFLPRPGTRQGSGWTLYASLILPSIIWRLLMQKGVHSDPLPTIKDHTWNLSMIPLTLSPYGGLTTKEKAEAMEILHPGVPKIWQLVLLIHGLLSTKLLVISCFLLMQRAEPGPISFLLHGINQKLLSESAFILRTRVSFWSKSQSSWHKGCITRCKKLSQNFPIMSQNVQFRRIIVQIRERRPKRIVVQKRGKISQHFLAPIMPFVVAIKIENVSLNVQANFF